MYEFYCDEQFRAVIAEARAERRAAVRRFWTAVFARGSSSIGRVAAN